MLKLVVPNLQYPELLVRSREERKIEPQKVMNISIRSAK